MNKPKLTKPIVNGSIDTWGDVLNKNIDVQDSYNQELINDSSRQDQELARLERDKISQSDLNTVVQNTVDNYVDNTSKHQLNQHVETINKPELDRYTVTKKTEINTFTEEQKVELDTYEKTKETQLNTHVNSKKTEIDAYVKDVSKVDINNYTTTKKSEINTFTEQQKTELDLHEKNKEVELDSYVANTSKKELDSYTSVKKTELDSHTTLKKSELDSHTGVKKTQLDSYTKVKESELQIFKETKTSEISNHTEEMKEELDALLVEKKQSLEMYKEEKIVDLRVYTSEIEIPRITKYTDSEIDRIYATGIDGFQEEIFINTGSSLTVIRDEEATETGILFKREKPYKLGELADKMYIEKQNKEDFSLKTSSKEIPKAINELYDEKLGKNDTATDSNRLGGKTSEFFAKQTDLDKSNDEIAQNKRDILLRLLIGEAKIYTDAKLIEDVLEILLPTKKFTICGVSKDDLTQSTILEFTSNFDKKHWIKTITTIKNDTLENSSLSYTEVKFEDNSL